MGGHIPEDIIKSVVEATDIVALINEYVPLKQAGSYFKGACPFHQEKTPSFFVSPQRQTFKCYGCGISGNSISFIMEWEKLSFPEAVRLLADRTGITVRETAEAGVRKSINKIVFTVNSWALNHYKNNLQKPEGKRALSYLKKRGFTEKTIQRFQLGFALNSRDTCLVQGEKKGFAPENMIRAGVVGEKDGRRFDYFRNRLMFPIVDMRQRVCGFGGRVMDDTQPKYLNTPETPVFKKSSLFYGLNEAKKSILKRKILIITEGYTDVIMLHQYGFDCAVATLGTSLTEEHTRKIKTTGCEAYMLFDADSAGQKAMMRSFRLFIQAGVNSKAAILPEGFDPCDYLQKYGREGMRKILNNAIPVFDYCLIPFHQARSRGEMEKASDALNQVIELCAEIGDAVYRGIVIQKVSEETAIPVTDVSDKVQRIIQGREKREQFQSERNGNIRTRKPDDTITAEHGVLAVIMQFPEFRQRVSEEFSEEDFTDRINRQIFKWMSSYAEDKREGLHHYIMNEAKDQTVSARVTRFMEETFTNREAYFNDCLQYLRSRREQKRRQDFTGKLSSIRREQDEDTEKEYLDKYLESKRRERK